MLASLGVMIGITFVLLMGWILGGLDRALQQTINVIGQDMLYVDKWDWAGGKSWKLIRQRKDLSMEQAKEFVEKIEGVKLAVPIARKWGGAIKYDSELYQGIGIQGVTYEYGLTPGGNVSEGRFFTRAEDAFGEYAAVIGADVNETIFPDGDALGRTIKMNGVKFRIIGVIEKRGTFVTDFLDKQVFMPLEAFKKTYGYKHRSVSVAVQAGSLENLDEARERTRGLMRQIRGVKPGEEDDFSINETKAFESSVQKLRLYVGGIGIGMTLLSFFVGIIGIMNIMFVSVSERTKEIGIRKAIGAKKISILVQFLIEAAILCFVGSIIAIGICSGFAAIGAKVIPMFWPDGTFFVPYLSPDLILIACGASLFVGALAGIIPAYRAARLDPVEALRFE